MNASSIILTRLVTNGSLCSFFSFYFLFALWIHFFLPNIYPTDTLVFIQSTISTLYPRNTFFISKRPVAFPMSVHFLHLVPLLVQKPFLFQTAYVHVLWSHLMAPGNSACLWYLRCSLLPLFLWGDAGLPFVYRLSFITDILSCIILLSCKGTTISTLPGEIVSSTGRHAQRTPLLGTSVLT